MAQPNSTPEQRGPQAYVAEFIGTFFLVFFICMIESVGNGLHYTDFAVVGLVHAFILAVLIYTLGGVSGAHFNPAVTVALTWLRKVRPADAMIYILVQLSGAVAAALLCRALILDAAKPVHFGAPSISPTFLHGSAGLAMLCEALGTAILLWAIVGTTVNERAAKDWAGLVIGMALGLAVMTFGPLTGGGLNPARSFGPALVAGSFGAAGTWVLAYVVGPLLGALAAAITYKVVVLKPQHLEGRRPIDTLPQ